jgi:hypothetical protein
MPVVFVLCVIGSYAIAQRMFDVWVMVLFGLFGFVLRQMKYPMAPLVLGIVLGDIFDKSFRRSWVINGGDFMFYFTRPICVVLMLMCLITVLMSYGPTRRYIAPKWRMISTGVGGGLGRILRAHGTLVLAIGRAIAAVFGRAETGPGEALRSGFSQYGKGVAGGLYDIGHGLFGALLSPFLDLARAARLMPRG